MPEIPITGCGSGCSSSPMTSAEGVDSPTMTAPSLQTVSLARLLSGATNNSIPALRRRLEETCLYCGHSRYLHKEIFADGQRGCNIGTCRCRWFVQKHRR